MKLKLLIQIGKEIWALNPLTLWWSFPQSAKDFLRYTGFVVFYSLILFQKPNEDVYWINQQLRAYIESQQLLPANNSFTTKLWDVIEHADYRGWLTDCLIPGIYLSSVPGVNASRVASLGTLHLCGGIRFRQIRVKEAECKHQAPGMNITRWPR